VHLCFCHPCAEQQRAAAAKTGTHVYKQDARNADVLVGMRDGVRGAFSLTWRPHAKVSVLDSGFMLGDGVWEGIRLHRGVLAFARVRCHTTQSVRRPARSCTRRRCMFICAMLCTGEWAR
jgi:hypothetical protein